MDCSPPGSSVHGIFQARALEWGAITFSEGNMRQGQKSEPGVLAEQVTCAGELGRYAELKSCPGHRVRMLAFTPPLTSSALGGRCSQSRSSRPSSLPHCSARERVLG